MRRACVAIRDSNSERTGTAISAAAVGVGARRSEAKSISVMSVSCPTAEISGIMEPAAARTTISSLKHHRSSSEPPPRATISTSGRGIGPSSGSALKPSMAAAISAAAPSPCTRTGQTSTWRAKAIVEPVQDIADHGAGRRGHHADHARQERQELLARLIEQPFGGELLLALLQQHHQRAEACGLQRLDHDLVIGAAGIGGDLAGDDDLEPVLGLDPHAAEHALPDHRIEPRALVLDREIDNGRRNAARDSRKSRRAPAHGRNWSSTVRLSAAETSETVNSTTFRRAAFGHVRRFACGSGGSCYTNGLEIRPVSRE